MKKQVLIIGAVLLVVIVGGIFVLGKQVETKSDLGGSDQTKTKSDLGSTTPTQWSQEGDYKIEETSAGTVVINERAGFSFKVPEGWELETQYFGEEEFTLEFLSPDAVRREGNPPLTKGCGMGLTTFFREDLWDSWNNDILRVQQYPEEAREGEKVIKVGGKLALWTALNAHDPAAIEIFGEIIQVHIPIDNNGVIEFGTTIMLDRQLDCKAEFDTFVSSFSIN